LPHLKGVFQDGHIGYEAARLVAAVATPANDAEWAERAKRRTLVHLREDIRAAELLSSVKRRRNVEPPSGELVMEVRQLEAAVVTGAVFAESAGTGQKSAAVANETQSDIAALWTAFAEARRTPSRNQSCGARETLRLRVQPEIRALYRGVERLYLRHRPRPMRFFQFACVTFIETWIRALPPVAYRDIYARDGLRCTNPFCARRDCTPHHVTFRAHGGGYRCAAARLTASSGAWANTPP
jgi:hypothetical protein